MRELKVNEIQEVDGGLIVSDVVITEDRGSYAQSSEVIYESPLSLSARIRNGPIKR